MFNILSQQRDTIKTILRFHLTKVRIAKVKWKKKTIWWHDVVKGNTHPSFKGVQTAAASMEIRMEV